MLDDTLDALRAAALAAGDGGGYFPALYSRVTRRVMADAAAGRFDDADRMAAFVHGFAARYLDAHHEPTTAPSCWHASFVVSSDQALLVVQQLFLGINAHVNFDLPQTVVALADQTGDIASIRPDFDSINAVLRETYDEVMGDLDRVTRWTGRVAGMGGGHLFNFSLHNARDQAWRTAERLHASAPALRATEVAALDQMVCVLAHLVTRPTVPFRWIAGLARRIETHDPATVTRALLGPLA
jgi:hypothetical protein